MKYLSILFVYFFLLIQNSYGFDTEKLITMDAKIGASKQDVHFRTPAANSILDWSTDTVDYGVDLKIRLHENFFTNIEYTYSEVKAGNSTDDDIENGLNIFSWHGVSGRGNDIKATIAYKTVASNKLSLIPLVGLFYKEFEASSENGVIYNNGTITDITDLNPGNQTNSKYFGLIIGGEAEYKFSKSIKGSIRAEYLLPDTYKANNIWYGRTPTLYWDLESSDDGNKGDNGVRVKFDLGFKISDSFIKYIKLFGYYELISLSGLIETEREGSQNPFSIDGANCGDCLSEGKAKFEAFGGGISLEF